MTELFRFFLIVMAFISSVSVMAATSVDVLFVHMIWENQMLSIS